MPDKTSLRELEKSLYRRKKLSLPPEEKISFGPTEPITSGEPRPDKLSRFGKRRFVWILSVIIVLALSLSVFIFWRGFFAFTKSRIELTITAPESIDSGSEVTWQVTIQNNNRTALEPGEIVFSFPKNSLSPSTNQPLLRQIRAIDSLEPGQGTQEEFRAVVIGGEGVNKIAQVVFRFQPQGSSLIFESVEERIIKIENFPIIISPRGPEETLSGENIKVVFDLFNESGRTFHNLRLRLEYPSGFKFKSASEELNDFNTVWSFDTIFGSEEKSIELLGTLSGLSGEGKIFRAFLEYREETRWQTYKEAAFRSNLAALPLIMEIKLAEEKNGAVFLNETLTYELSWRNNFDVPLGELTLTAELKGELFDISTLQTNGEVDIKEFKIKWSGAQVPLLSILRPNERGVVTFRIKTQSSFPADLVKPTLTVGVRLDSKTKPPGLTVEKLQVIKNHQTKVHGEIRLTTSVFYNEPNSAFKNTGPYPLQVGQDTTLTVHWGLQSLANNFKNVRIKAVLPSGISWAEETRVSLNPENFQFSAVGREVTWEIDNLLANSLEEVIFKIVARPLPSQEGKIMPLLSETELFAEDDFTANKIDLVNPTLNSTLPDDIAGSGSAGRVQP